MEVFFGQLIFNYNLLADYGRELTKLINIGQSNAAKLNGVVTKLETIEGIVKDQKEQIEEIMSILKDREMITTEIKMKGKVKKDQRTDNFYWVNILFLLFYTLFIFAYNYLNYRMLLKKLLTNFSMSINNSLSNS